MGWEQDVQGLRTCLEKLVWATREADRSPQVDFLLDDLEEFTPETTRWLDVLKRVENCLQTADRLFAARLQTWLDGLLKAAKQGDVNASFRLWVLIEQRLRGFVRARTPNDGVADDCLAEIKSRLFERKKDPESGEEIPAVIDEFDPDRSGLVAFVKLFLGRRVIDEYWNGATREKSLDGPSDGEDERPAHWDPTSVHPGPLEILTGSNLEQARLRIFEALWGALWICRKPHQQLCFAYGHLWDWSLQGASFGEPVALSTYTQSPLGSTSLGSHFREANPQTAIADSNYRMRGCIASKAAKCILVSQIPKDDVAELLAGRDKGVHATIQSIIDKLLDKRMGELAANFFNFYVQRSGIPTDCLYRGFQPMADALR